MFLNDNQYLYAYLYWGKSLKGHICPMLANQYPKIFTIFFFHLKKKNFFNFFLTS